MNFSTNTNTPHNNTSFTTLKNPVNSLLAFTSLTGLILYYSVWIVKLIIKYRYKLEPLHLVSLNCLANNLFGFSVGFLVRLNEHLGYTGKFCSVAHFFHNWSKVTISQSFCLMEIERFLALHWNLLYADRVTNQRTCILIGLVKIISLGLFFTDAWDSELYLGCDYSKCHQIEIESFFMVVTSYTVYFFTTVSVCVYVFLVAKNAQNEVVPIFYVGQEQNEIVTPQSHLAKLAKIGLKVNFLSLIQLIPEFIVNSASVIFEINDFSCLDYQVFTVAQLLLIVKFLSCIIVPILLTKKIKHYYD